MMYSLQAKLGVIPDFLGMHESPANTSLVFHAGDFPRHRCKAASIEHTLGHIFFCFLVFLSWGTLSSQAQLFYTSGTYGMYISVVVMQPMQP